MLHAAEVSGTRQVGIYCSIFDDSSYEERLFELLPCITLGEALSIMAYETQKLITTPCPMYGYWYQRFSLGMHKRMGDVVRLDYAVTSRIVKELLEHLDSEWEATTHEKERKWIADMAFF
jgi:hypothetical protein